MAEESWIKEQCLTCDFFHIVKAGPKCNNFLPCDGESGYRPRRFCKECGF